MTPNKSLHQLHGEWNSWTKGEIWLKLIPTGFTEMDNNLEEIATIGLKDWAETNIEQTSIDFQRTQ